MTSAEVARWINRFHEAWRGLDAGAIADLFSMGASYATGPFSEVIEGRQAIRGHWEHELQGVTAVAVTFARPVVDNDRAAVEWSARIESDGTTVLDAGVLILEFADGLCTASREYWMVEPQPEIASISAGDQHS